MKLEKKLKKNFRIKVWTVNKVINLDLWMQLSPAFNAENRGVGLILCLWKYKQV